MTDVLSFPKRPRIVNARFLPLDAAPVSRLEGVRAVGRCPLCGQEGVKLSRAHVVPKGLYGDDVPENAAWICGDGVMGCHGLLTHANRVIGHPIDVYVARVRFIAYCRYAVPELGQYADAQKGPGWLEDYYGGAA